MIFEDDTPSKVALPVPYPREPPRNLLPAALLRPANLFAFEGVDASGKSTLIERLARHYRGRGREVIIVKLGGSELIRHAMDRAAWVNADPMSINLLNWVSLYHQMTALRTHYNTASLIFVDRYTLTVKIRGQLEGLADDFMHLLDAGLPRPAATFVIDSSVETCLDRVRGSGRRITYFEAGVRDVERTGEPMRERDARERDQDFDREAPFRRHLERMRAAYLRAAREGTAIYVVENSSYVNVEDIVVTVVHHIDQISAARLGSTAKR